MPDMITKIELFLVSAEPLYNAVIHRSDGVTIQYDAETLAALGEKINKELAKVTKQMEEMLVSLHATLQQHIATNLCASHGLERQTENILNRLTNLRSNRHA